jgi:hypothetical protein
MKSILSLALVLTFGMASQASASGCDGSQQAAPVELVSETQVDGQLSCFAYSLPNMSNWSFCRFQQSGGTMPILTSANIETVKAPKSGPVTTKVKQSSAFLFNYCEYGQYPSPVPPANGYLYETVIGGVELSAIQAQ